MDVLQPTFSGGEVSPLLYGRTDLTKYGTSLRKCRNWIIRPHGCLMNRPGSEYIATTKFGAGKKSRLVPFVFSQTEAYVLEFTEGFVRVYGTSVLVPEYATPYLESDLDTLQFTQSADVLTITCTRVPQQEIRRTSTTPTFSVTQPSYNSGPFLTQNTDVTYQVSVSATSGTVTITANKPIFNANHVGALFRLEQEDVSTIKPWEPTKIIATGAASPVGEIRRNDGKTYKCTAAAGSAANTATGTIPPTWDSGAQMDGDGNKIASFADVVGITWTYLDSGYGIARITAFTSSTQVTATVLRAFPSTVIGSSSTSAGPWSFTGDGATTVFGPLTGNTSAVSADYIVSFSTGLVSALNYTVTQPNGNITFATPPPFGTTITIWQIGSGSSKHSSLWSFGAWSPDQGYPATCTYFQDRIFFAGTPGQPQRVEASKVGSYYDFGTSVPSQDDDGLSFSLNARQINSITDLIAVESLLASTSAAIWRVTDGIDEVLTPTTLGFKPQNSIGSSSSVRSVNVGDSVIYVQSDGRRIRDLLYELQFDKFTGNELSLLAEHLFPVGTTVKRLDYAQFPFSLVHAVRSDGFMPSLSYLRDQDVMGWSPWDTDGTYEDACSIPQSGRSATYVIVKRNINGADTRYIERFASREFTDLTLAIFVDAGVTRGGFITNSSSAIMLTGGTTWDIGDTITAAINILPNFDPSSVGDQVHVKIGTTIARLTIIAYVSPNVVTCTPLDGLIPVAFRGVSVANWAHAKKVFTATHLAGETVSVLADGYWLRPYVVAADGTLTLDAPYATIVVGLAYKSDVETLDVNIPGAPTVRSKRKSIPAAQALIYQTRGLKFGPDEDHLEEMSARETEALDAMPNLQDDIIIVHIPTTPDQSGRLFARQEAPLPVTLIGLIPDVEFGE